jgi:hypothetical protein
VTLFAAIGKGNRIRMAIEPCPAKETASEQCHVTRLAELVVLLARYLNTRVFMYAYLTLNLSFKPQRAAG